MTIVLQDNEHDIDRAAALLRQGELVAFPTETVYGLGADSTNARAVDLIFTVKGRPADNPLIVHVSSQDQVLHVADLSSARISAIAKRLMDAFWPGPLSLVVPARERVPANVRAGLPTVAVRMPDHGTALRLIERTGRPLAAPSANRSGRPSPTTAAHVLDDLAGSIAAVVDGGTTRIGLESTVVDVTVVPPLLLRPGAISASQLERVLGRPVAVWRKTGDPVAGDTSNRAEACEVIDGSVSGTERAGRSTRVDDGPTRSQGPKGSDGPFSVGEPLPSPGLRYRHYAPQARLGWLDREFAARLADQLMPAGEKHGYLSHGFADRALDALMHELAARHPADWQVIPLGRTLAEIAARLYDALRESDRRQLTHLWIAPLPESGLGLAITDRLQRAMEPM